MIFCHRTSKKINSLLMLLGVGVLLPGCTEEQEETSQTASSSEQSEDSDSPESSDPAESVEEPSVGIPVGELVPIDHETAKYTIETNLKNQICEQNEEISAAC